LNFSSFLPEISLLALLILTSFFRFFEIKNKKLYRISFISAILLITFFLFQQFFFSPHIYMFDTMTFDSFGTLLKLISLSGFISCILISYDKKKFTDSRETILYSIILFSMFISISSSNLLLTFCSFELLSFSYFTFIKISTRTKSGSLKLSSFYTSWIISSALMLFGISLFYGLFGSMNYFQINEFISTHFINKLTFAVSIILLFSGFAFKLFTFPLQSVVTEIFTLLSIDKLSAILLVSIISGYSAFMRFFYTVFTGSNSFNSINNYNELFNWELFIVLFVCINILSSFVMLYLQKELINTMLYLIFVNIPLVFISFICTQEYIVINFLFVIIYLVITIIGIFLTTSIIRTKYNVSVIYDLKGSFKSSRLISSVFFIFLLNISGIPVTYGFFSRLYLFSSINSNYALLILIVSIIASFISLKIIYRIISLTLSESDINITSGKVNLVHTIILALTLFLTITVGIFPGLLTGYLKYIIILLP